MKKILSKVDALISSHHPLILLGICLIGLALRMLAATRGHNFDIDSYRIVADIVAANGNVYAETTRYNYGPIWFHILHAIDSFQIGNYSGFEFFRLKIAGFLSLVDVGIFIFLLRTYSPKVAAIFFLNPISIIITGYHGQFDNLAILVAFVSMHFYSKEDKWQWQLASLSGLGLSLCIKHILFVFPLWLAIKEKTWSRRIWVVFIPYFAFLASFAYYALEGHQGIIKNVFQYKSFDNAPFWAAFAANFLLTAKGKLLLFIAALMFVGIKYKKENNLDSLHLYLIALVVFSSAVANQYLAIPVPSIAVLWNVGYAIYTFCASTLLVVDYDGLNVAWIQNIIHWKGGSYRLVVWALFFGLSITLFGREKVFQWIRDHYAKLKSQIARLQQHK